MLFTYWMYNCLLQLSVYKYAQWPAYFPPTSRLLSPRRLSAWWPRRWCRDTRSFSLKGVSQRSSSRSMSALCPALLSGWWAGDGCQSHTLTWTLPSFQDTVFYRDAQKDDDNLAGAAARSVWNQSFTPRGHSCSWNYATGRQRKANRKRFEQCSFAR